MRLIDADFFNNFDYSCFDGRLSEDAIQGMNTVLDLIDKSPTIDAYPVRHGRWIDKGEYAVCMECSGRSGTQYDGVEPIPLMTQFCPHCGAKMDEVMNNENK